MANTNSDLVANLEASPQVLSPPGKLAGRVRIAVSSVEVTAADFDAVGDTIKLASIPSNARINSIKIANDDLDSGADSAFDLGLLDRDGAVKDVDVYATAVSLQTASALRELVNEARDIAKQGQRVFEDAGDTDDTDELLDVVMTQVATVSGALAGTVAFEIEYTVG